MSEQDNPIESSVQEAFSKKLSRRNFLKGAAVTALGLALTPDRSQAVESNIVGEANFSLPVEEDKKDIRLGNAKNSLIRVDESMMTNPTDLPVKDIEFNPKFTRIIKDENGEEKTMTTEAQNMLDLVSTGALIQAHTIFQEYLGEEKNVSRLEGMLFKGELPPEPNWAEYIQKLQSDEELKVPFMAIPTNTPVDKENLQWMDVNMKERVRYKFMSDPNQMFSVQSKKDGKGGVMKDENGEPIPADGYTIRVNSEGGLQLDIYTDLSEWRNALPDIQGTYDMVFAYVMRKGLAASVLTLGTHNQDGGLLLLPHLPNYSSKIHEGELFPDQFNILTGGDYKKPENALTHTVFPSK